MPRPRYRESDAIVRAALLGIASLVLATSTVRAQIVPDLTEAPAPLVGEVLLPRGEIRLQWSRVEWANYYELEWTHINDYDSAIVSGPPGRRYDFRFESTRIPVRPADPTAGEVEYLLPLVFYRGHVLWRVRAVALGDPDSRQPLPGAWSAFPDDTGTSITASPSAVYIGPAYVHERVGAGLTSLNWQHIATFAERGTRKDVVTYLDGSLRSRQSVTRLSVGGPTEPSRAENLLLVAETIYDHAGRPAIEILPSPVQRGFSSSSKLRYQNLFTLNLGGRPYSYRDFEFRPASGEATPGALGNNRGAGRYFSPANPDQAGHQAHVPDAEGYPFVQRSYTPDSTNRIAAEGGPGPAHRIGSGHERRYYYGVPAQAELDRLFGNDVGFARHYKKQLHIDPDQQGSIEYIDPEGHVIATALVGTTPPNLLPVSNDARTTFTFDLLSDPQVEIEDNERRSNKTIVSHGGEYSFEYHLPSRETLDAPTVRETACNRSDICHDCVYRLKLEILDSHGENRVPPDKRSRRIGSVAELCTSDRTQLDINFSVSLEPGSYQVNKRLIVDEQAVETYVNNFLRDNRCRAGIRGRLRRGLLPDFRPEQCTRACTECATEELRRAVALRDGSANRFWIEQRRDLGPQRRQACQRTCNASPEATPCEAGYGMMLADVSPGGQYAGYSVPDPAEPDAVITPALSVLNDMAANALPLASANWRHPKPHYQNEDGSPSFIPIPEGDGDICLDRPADGRCLPQRLAHVRDFIRFWKPSWAEALVVYHPEYGYHRWCKAHEAMVRFGHRLRKIDSYAQAQSQDLLDPLDDDPLIQANPSLRDEIVQVDTRCGPVTPPCRIGTCRNIYELVHLTVSCNNPNFTEAEAQACASARASEPLGTVAETANDEWRIFRDFYRSQREVAMERIRERWISQPSQRGFVSNRCIGREDRSACPDPMNHAEYADKEKRFPGEQDALTAFAREDTLIAAGESYNLVPDRQDALVRDAVALFRSGSCADRKAYLDRRLYEICGKCPRQVDLETLLSAAASSDRLLRDFDLPRFPVIPTRGLLDTFPNPRERRYSWSAAVTRDEVEIGIHARSREQCRIRLHKSDPDVSWKFVRGFRCLAPLDTPQHFPRVRGKNWIANALLADGSLMEVEGFASCLDLSKCDLERLCTADQARAKEMVALSRYLFTAPFTQSNLLLHQTGRTGGSLGPGLRAFGSGPNWYWRFLGWGPPAGNRGSFSGQLESGVGGEFNESSCRLTFRSLTPGQELQPGLQIQQARGIFREAAEGKTCASRELVLEAINPKGEQVLISVTSACHELGQCCAKKPAACHATELGSGPSPPFSPRSRIVRAKRLAAARFHLIMRGGRNISARLMPAGNLRSVSPVNQFADVTPPATPVIPIPDPEIMLPPKKQTTHCDRCCPRPGLRLPYYETACEDQLESRLGFELNREYENAVKDLREEVRRAYLHRCLSTREIFEAAVTENIHHFTLFYYDQAGNLVRTVPPKGVQTLSDDAISNVQEQRDYLENPATIPARPAVFPNHSLGTTYRHNSFDEVRTVTTPDSGTSHTWYDRLGRPVLSRDARQQGGSGRLFGYIVYDEFGRTIQSGELEAGRSLSGAELNVLAMNDMRLRSWVTSGRKTEHTITHYDAPISSAINAYFTGGQQHLRGRVASIERHSMAADGTPWRHATHFSYDVHGNVKTLVQENPQMPAGHRIKTIEYDYDLVTGQVEQVRYQPGKADQFIHRYSYDADDRLIMVETSTDGINWDRDAAYTYYHHGPLARLELGQERVQGLDYAYTIGGQLKGVNSDSLMPERDIGKDGLPPGEVAADVFGFVLGYYPGDYRPIGRHLWSRRLDALTSAAPFAIEAGGALYGGNISYVTTANRALDPVQQAAAHRYDALNRLRSSTVHRLDAGGHWTATSSYATTVSYDPNGNIETLTRNGADGSSIDNLDYRYQPNNNRLDHVVDAVGPAVEGDLPSQGSGNYRYDANGQLTRDSAAGITNIAWTAAGKVKRVTKGDGVIDFEYDALGRRVMKRTPESTLWYVLNANGAILATYKQRSDELQWNSAAIYGVSRLGALKPDRVMPNDGGGPVAFVRGEKRYELTNHLGSVLAIISDARGALGSAETFNASDYYPFGMLQPGRYTSRESYRFGFQGMEQDDGIRGTGNSYTTEFRQYASQLGRWLGPDPKASSSPSVSPYVAFNNAPVLLVDERGAQAAEFDPLSRHRQPGTFGSNTMKRFRWMNQWMNENMMLRKRGVQLLGNATANYFVAKNLGTHTPIGVLVKGLRNVSAIQLNLTVATMVTTSVLVASSFEIGAFVGAAGTELMTRVNTVVDPPLDVRREYERRRGWGITGYRDAEGRDPMYGPLPLPTVQAPIQVGEMEREIPEYMDPSLLQCGGEDPAMCTQGPDPSSLVCESTEECLPRSSESSSRDYTPDPFDARNPGNQRPSWGSPSGEEELPTPIFPSGP